MADAGRRRVAARLLLDLARRTGAVQAVLAVVYAVISGIGAILTTFWMKRVLDGVVHGQRTSTAVAVAAAGLGVNVCVSAAAEVAAGMRLGELQFRCGLVLVQDVMRFSGSVPGIEHHERPEYLDRTMLLRQQMFYLSGFLPAIGNGVGLLARIATTVVLLWLVHPALLALPVLALPSLWAGSRAEAIVNRAIEATAPSARRQAHLFELATTAGPAKEVRIFGLGDELVQRQRAEYDTVTETVGAAQLKAGLLRTAGWLLFAAGYVGAVAWVVVRAGRGEATAGDVLLVLVLAGQVNGQVAQAVNLVTRSTNAFRVLARYAWLRDYSVAASAGAGGEAPPARLAHGLDLDGVTFRYPGTDHDVLQDVHLHVAAGSTVAIVGENGAGKTSLVKLLCGFYRPAAGTIRIDGVDLSTLDVEAWRRRLSGGFQDFARLELLLRESVGLGDQARLDDAVAVAGVLDRVGADLPIGLEAQLGRQWPGGVDLSEGQWQKVAMARALMRESPLVILLDEPTSGLDAHAEHELFELFAEVAADVARRSGAVAVLVSHRFSTVRMADRIVVLDGGRVVEEGTHADLVAAGGLYAELYGIQAQAYR